MVSTRVIRIDQEVWTELQERAVPFEDNPNSVLRRLLGLTPNRVSENDDPRPGLLDTQIAKLIYLVIERVDEAPIFSLTKTGQSHTFKSQRGKVVAFIFRQRRRLKVESSEQMAREVGINTWDHRLKNGWWSQDNSVYWYVPNGDDDAYERVADVLDRLWRS